MSLGWIIRSYRPSQENMKDMVEGKYQPDTSGTTEQEKNKDSLDLSYYLIKDTYWLKSNFSKTYYLKSLHESYQDSTRYVRWSFAQLFSAYPARSRRFFFCAPVNLTLWHSICLVLPCLSPSDSFFLTATTGDYAIGRVFSADEKRDNGMNTYLWVSTVPRGSEPSEWASPWTEPMNKAKQL